MTAYIMRRLAQTMLTVLAVSVVVFIVTMQLPGDAALASIQMDEAACEETIQAIRARMGLDRPIHIQYFAWLGSLLRGEFGSSLRTRQPVGAMFQQRIHVTLQLLAMSLLFSLVIAIPLGIFAAAKANSWLDTMSTVVAVSGVSIPNFLVAVILILFFSLRLNWLPASGYVHFHEDMLLSFKHLLMPAIALGTAGAAGIMRQLRSSAIDVLQEEYITTARAKGLSETVVTLKHLLRNALLPVVTILGMTIGRSIGGSVIVENIFMLPGVGGMLLNAVSFRDFPVLQFRLVVVALSVTLLNLLTDILYAILDPRIRYQ